MSRRHGANERQCLCHAKFQYRSASDVVQDVRRLAEWSPSWLSQSSEAEHPPLLVPGERQTRVRQHLVRSQIARLAPVEDGLDDVRGEIAEAKEPREVRWAYAFPLDQFVRRQSF